MTQNTRFNEKKTIGLQSHAHAKHKHIKYESKKNVHEMGKKSLNRKSEAHIFQNHYEYR